MKCPLCKEPVVWDDKHEPPAYRHTDNDSRWCELSLEYPSGCTDKDNPAYTREWKYYC